MEKLELTRRKVEPKLTDLFFGDYDLTSEELEALFSPEEIVGTPIVDPPPEPTPIPEEEVHEVVEEAE